MKKLQFLIIFLLPISLFSQYAEVWNINEEFIDPVNKPYMVSKIEIADNGTIYTSLASVTHILNLAGSNSSGEKLFSFTNNISNAVAAIQNSDSSMNFYVDESHPNKFLLQENSLFIRYYNLLKSDEVKETYAYPITHGKPHPSYYNTNIVSKAQNQRSYTAVFNNNFGLKYADTIWKGHTFEGRRIIDYIFSSSGVYNENEKNYLLSPDTLGIEPNQAIGIPIAIRRFSNQDFLVVIASEEVSSSKPVDVSFRILDSNNFEISKFKIDASTMNLNGGNLTIRDVELLGDVIFMTGYTYTQSGIKHPFFAKINRDGTMLSYKTLLSNAEMKRIIKLNDNTLIAVGKTLSTVDKEVVTKRYLVELASDLTVNQSVEFSGEGNGYLNDVAVSPEGDVYIGGSENGLPYLAKVVNNVTSVQVPQPAVSTTPEAVFIHPNPAKSTATITFQNPQEGIGSIKLYAMDGTLVATLLEGAFSQQKEFTFSLSEVPIGSYTLLVTSQNKSIRTPITVIR